MRQFSHDWPPSGPVVLAMGTFDGVHRGHQTLLQKAYDLSQQKQAQLVILTLHPHPREVLDQSFQGYILGFEHRVGLLEEYGCVYQFEFSAKTATLSPKKFLDAVFQADLEGLVVGHDFRFGYRGEGTVATIAARAAEAGIAFEMQDAVLDGSHQRLSSSALRSALQSGDLQTYRQMTGRAFEVRGPVVAGAGRGRRLGYPTANINARQVLLKNGVYCVEETGILKSSGLANLGWAPTFGGHQDRMLEVHFPDAPEADFYDHHLRVQFRIRLRDEIRFESSEALLKQLKDDVGAYHEWKKNRS